MDVFGLVCGCVLVVLGSISVARSRRLPDSARDPFFSLLTGPVVVVLGAAMALLAALK